ncbi:MAG: hypothetical protein LAO09_15870, partial [Acidobacteriia bacterium]|nr:hypothetical protein [Terriglobia bacterium]
MDEQTKSVTSSKQAPVIEPGYTFATVTDKISAIVLQRPTSNGWFVGFGIGFLLTLWFFVTPICYPDSSLPPGFLPLFAKNPIYVLVRGYRAIFLHS